MANDDPLAPTVDPSTINIDQPGADTSQDLSEYQQTQQGQQMPPPGAMAGQQPQTPGGWGDLTDYQTDMGGGGVMGRLKQGLSGLGGRQGWDERPPAGAAVTARHGGLLTGIAGVLLDGLAASMAPDARSALEFPMQRREANAQIREANARSTLQEQQAQEEAAIAPTKVKLMQMDNQMKIAQLGEVLEDMNAAVKLGISGHAQQMTQDALDKHAAEIVTQGDPQMVMDAWHKIQNDPTNKDALYIQPHVDKTDANGDATHMQLVKIHPDVYMPARTIHDSFPTLDGKSIPFDVDIPAGTPPEQQAVYLAKLHGVIAQNGQNLKDSKQLVMVAQGPSPMQGGVGNLKMMTMKEAHDAGVKPENIETIKDPEKVRNFSVGMNDTQSAINALATNVNWKNVQWPLVAAMLEEKDPEVAGLIHVSLPQRFWAQIRMENISQANEDTRSVVKYLPIAYEGIGQLPRLQTLGQTSRGLGGERQAKNAQRTLPMAGDDDAMARGKLGSIQTILLDPLKRASPKWDMAPLIPSFLESSGQSEEQFSAGAAKEGTGVVPWFQRLAPGTFGTSQRSPGEEGGPPKPAATPPKTGTDMGAAPTGSQEGRTGVIRGTNTKVKVKDGRIIVQ